MRICAVPLAVSVLALAACSSVPPRPEDRRAEELPLVRLTAGERQRCDQLTERAVEAMRGEQLADAERTANDALALDPRAARALAVRGLVLQRKVLTNSLPDQQWVYDADVATLMALQLAPDDAFVGWARVVFLRDSLHLSAAAALGEQVAERAAQAPVEERADLLIATADCRYELGEERAALPLLRAYTGLRPGDAAAFYRLGCCLLRIAEAPEGEAGLGVAQSQAEAAARAFLRSVELKPTDIDASLAAGAAWFRAGELAAERKDAAVSGRRRQAALAQFDKLVAQDPEAAEPHYRRGVVLEAVGEREAAAAAYREALQRDADHLGAVLNLLALVTDLQQRRELAELALRIDRAATQLTAGERRKLGELLKQP